MGQLELLWEYQQSDVEVYNLNRLIKRSPNRLRLLKLRESLKEQQGMLKGIEDEVLAMVDRTDALKDAVSMMEDQLRQLQARIQENPASSSVDVQGYMEEVARITASLDEYEQEIRSIRRNAAERDKRQRDIKVRAIRCKQEFDELRVEYDAEYQEKSEELEKLTAIAKSKREGIEPKYYDSIVNKTPLSAKTNRTVGNKAPSAYLTLLQQQAGIGEPRMDEILESHNVYPLAARLDEFYEFFRMREAELLRRIENAMGKPVVGVAAPQETFADDADDESNGAEPV